MYFNEITRKNIMVIEPVHFFKNGTDIVFYDEFRELLQR